MDITRRMVIRCRVQEVIVVLVELGLPQELACDLVYKWKAVEHPAVIALRTDAWLQQVREQYELWADKRTAPNSTTCVCPRNHIKGNGFDWELGHTHRHTPLRIWPMISPRSRVWMEKIHGPPKTSDHNISMRCSRSILCMRYFRHTIPSLDVRICAGDTGVLDEGAWDCVDCVRNRDDSLAMWLQHAPQNALEDYLQGVAGWSKEKMIEHLDKRHDNWFVTRKDLVKMCLEH